MSAIRYDLRQAVRTLARMPGTTLLSVVTLGLGIAAATTTFSAVYAAIFRPIPFQDPDRLLYLQTTRQTAGAGTVLLRWSLAKADALREQARSFAAISTYTRSYVGIAVARAEAGNAEQIDCEVVGAGYFDVLQVSPAIGRVFTPEEEAPGHAVVVLGDAIWKRQFGGDPAALGRTLLVNGVPLTVVGVMPPGFDGVSGYAAFWWPRGMAPQLTYREYLTTPQHFLNLVARLRPGVTLAQANAELAALGPGLPMTVDPNAEPARWSATAIPLGKARVDASQRRVLMLLLAGGGCVLLVTCVNVAMLLLTRARSRRGEMAIRLALGAARRRLVQHLLVESALIATAGGVLGVLLAGWGITWLRHAAPAVMPSPQNNYGQISGFATPSLDGAILVFVALIAIATTLAFGIAPALTASGAAPADALAVSSRGVAGRGRGGALTMLVTSQIAVAVLLLSGALLLAGTVSRLQADRSGFDDSALTFWVNAPASRYADEQGPQVVA
jgi:predicted permease